jgi:hypothetical protein
MYMYIIMWNINLVSHILLLVSYNTTAMRDIIIIFK